MNTQIITTQDPQYHKLQLFKVQKQIEYLKELREKNQAIASKLKDMQKKVIAKMKHNDSLLKNFRYRRYKGEEVKNGIVGVSFYNFQNEQHLPKSLQTYYQLQVPKEKQSVFLKNVFQSTNQPELPQIFANCRVKLQTIIKGYPNNPSTIPFDRIGVFYGVTGLKVYELWRAEKLKPDPKKIPFSQQQNQQILKRHQKYGDNWRHISKFTQFRSSEDLYYQFNVINPSFKKGRWKLSENVKLLILVEYYEVPNYHKMGLKLKTRSQGQIRQRYINVLDPQKRVIQWTEQEIKMLLEKASYFKYKWAKLSSNLFEHKTDNQVWRKFRGLMAQKSIEEIQEFVFDEKVCKSIIEYKHKYRIQSKATNNTLRKQPKIV